MRLSLILGVLLATGACSDGNEDDDGLSYNCADETRDDEFVLGLMKPGESSRYEFKLVSSDPAPPARTDNRFVLELSTMAAPVTPVAGAELSVIPFMPDHAHGSGDPVVVTPMTEAGRYELYPVNLWMPGLWEVTMQVKGAQSDRAVFRFCLSN
jgi:hypothetical protein